MKEKHVTEGRRMPILIQVGIKLVAYDRLPDDRPTADIILAKIVMKYSYCFCFFLIIY